MGKLSLYFALGLSGLRLFGFLTEPLLAKPDNWLGANLVLLALASVAASSIATLLAQRTQYEHAIPVTMGVLSVFMIVFCELAPKIYASLKPDPVAMSSTYIYKMLVFVMAACFFGEMSFVKPPAVEVLKGLFIPRLKGAGATGDAIALLGALIMP